MAMLYLIATPEAISYCGDILERFGELLPITLEGQPGYYLWNNTNQRSDLLDQKLCEYDSGRLAKVVFDPEKLTTPMIFCIPEYPKLNLVLTGLDDDEMDFYARYHQHGLTGLTFKTLWAAQ